MRLANVDFPNPLLDALHNNKVVVFAGAGVSMGEPANLPNFETLTEIIARGAIETKRKNETLEQFLGRLHDRDVNVHDLAKIELSQQGLRPTPLHRGLLRLYRKDQSIRLVTTNFDLLFEQAAEQMFDNAPEVYHAPILPFRHQLNGIIHIHGSICYPEQMVLTDKDFGRAYLSEASATRFLLDMYDKYIFLFVGYSHNDTVMNYLVRSLPPKGHSPHYALIADSKDADYQHWDSLEIEMIPYPQHERDHSELDKAISKLADYVQRGMVGWHREISAIADKRPCELNEEEKGLIDYVLEDKTKTEFFTKSASSPQWIKWLDNRGHLDRLFKDGRLKESDKTLSWWLVNKYLEDHSDLIFLLIASHRTRLHPTFWQDISHKIGSGNDTPLDTTVLSRWIALLLSTAPEKGETSDGVCVNTSYYLTSIAQRCIPRQMIKELLLIFDTMIRSLLSIEENRYRPRGKTEIDFQISLDVPLVGDHDDLEALWQEGLKPHLSKIAQPLLEQVIRSLGSQYSFYCTWGRANRLLEPASTRRSAIDPHSQNVGYDENDVLIDAARDSLDWLATHETDVAVYWCNRLVKSDSPLQRRLAAHSLSTRKDLTLDEKIQWLLEHIDLHEHSIHHEVYQAVRHAYLGASEDCRMALIERVQSYQSPHAEHPDNRELTAKVQYGWFHWLHDTDPDCEFAKQAMDEVLMEYPHIAPGGLREHPDFTSYIQSGGIDIPSPLTCEDLLANPTPDKIIQFSSLEAPVIRGEIERLKRAIKEDYDRGLNLTNTLVEAELWDSNLWRVLIETWAKMELDINQHRQVLEYFARTELCKKYSYEITDGLYALVKTDGPSYALELLPQALQVAAAIWKSLERPASIDIKHGWYKTSGQYPIWALTHFWLSAASHWRQQQDPEPVSLSETYRRFLLDIIKDTSPLGGLGKSILASKLEFLLAVDEEWTRAHLLPLFEPDSADFRAVWDGFVTGGRLNPPVAQSLRELFLTAVTRLNTDLFYQRLEFVEKYTVMLIFVVDDALETWIPELFKHSNRDSQPANQEPTLLREDNHTIPDIFALAMAHRLQEMNDSDKEELWQGWLKEYWRNRLYGKPAPLTSDEAGRMLDWLAELKTQFSEAVDLTIENEQGPSLKNTRIFACLITYKTWENYPEAVAKLLIYLWKWNIPYWKRDSVSQIIKPLLESEISSELKQQLEEIRIQLP